MVKYNIGDIRTEFIYLKMNDKFKIDKSGCKIIEILNANFIADEDSIFGTLNEDYALREIEWYNSQSLNVFDIPGEVPKIWKDVSDINGYINSNYGFLVFSNQNFSQFDNCLNELKKNPNSRRAVMHYSRPSIWYQFDSNGMSDYICCFNSQYFIEDSELISMVSFRSNDAIFGYRNDFYWQKYIHNLLAEKLNVKPGKIYWSANSLHIYERHFHLIK